MASKEKRNIFDLLASGTVALSEQTSLEASEVDDSLDAHGVTLAASPPIAPEADASLQAGSLSAETVVELGSTSCKTCGLRFDDLKAQREHFKTDLHRLNLKRRSANKAPLSETEAEAALDALDAESLSGSESEEESDREDLLEESAEKNASRDDAAVRREEASMMVGLKLLDSNPVKLAWVPAAVALDRKREEADLLPLKEKPLWLILLHGAGHFAGVVLKNGRTVVASKSFHRYVIRAKQGKAQSANDNAKGNAKSAGAHIRRHNEQMLKTEIGELLESWTSHIKACSRVFVSISKTNQHIFFGNDSVLSSKDPRIRRIPFPVRRPTVKGATEVGQRLATALVESEAEYLERKVQSEEKKKLEAERIKAQKLRALQGKQAPPDAQNEEHEEVEEPEDPALLTMLLEACKAGDLATVIMSIGQDAEVINLPSRRQEWKGGAALHVAARAGHQDLVRLLLENGASPTLPDLRGCLPYMAVEESKACREVFRRYRGEHPDKWDYSRSGIPEAITDESEAARKEKQKEKKKKQTQRKKEQKAKERKRQEEAEKKKAAEEAAILANAPSCDMCQKKLSGKSSDWFNRLDFYYCSPECMQGHRRKLQAEAALARMGR
mmetsp:Transcript_4270/g.9224  ORF Transcript_4270/g.9224 Transcript_4270/m.9224 type:complete len:613 (-) Transcript_4270:93-1931(-)